MHPSRRLCRGRRGPAERGTLILQAGQAQLQGLTRTPAASTPGRTHRAGCRAAASDTVGTCRCRPTPTGSSRITFPPRSAPRTSVPGAQSAARSDSRARRPAASRPSVRSRFVEADADGAVQEFQPIDSGGRPIGKPTLRSSSWLELRYHASQPASATVIDEVDLGIAVRDRGVLALHSRYRRREHRVLVRQRPRGHARSGGGARWAAGLSTGRSSSGMTLLSGVLGRYSRTTGLTGGLRE